jgi:hypothetical protein
MAILGSNNGLRKRPESNSLAGNAWAEGAKAMRAPTGKAAEDRPPSAHPIAPGPERSTMPTQKSLNSAYERGAVVLRCFLRFGLVAQSGGISGKQNSRLLDVNCQRGGLTTVRCPEFSGDFFGLGGSLCCRCAAAKAYSNRSSGGRQDFGSRRV